MSIFNLNATDSDYDEVINYSHGKTNNAINALQNLIDNNKIELKFDIKNGYLRSVLKALNISTTSQLLVFSKTSFQPEYISPTTPRSIYFNDNVYVAWVQFASKLEISTQDAKLGTVFYTLNQSKTDKPQFVRQTSKCFQCHQSNKTENIPGHIVRSVFPNSRGFPILRNGTFKTNHASPLKQRWGGWYVTGNSGKQAHMGNKIATETKGAVVFDINKELNQSELGKYFDTSPYLQKTSDIVALMIMEHQTYLQNIMNEARFSTIMALKRQKTMNQYFNKQENNISTQTLNHIHSRGDKIVQYLLFCDEIKLESEVIGSESFKKAFEQSGKFDSKGMSLKQLNLKNRLFEYPLSYIIYSETFDNLPPLLKNYIYKQLWEILTGKNQSEKYEHLTRSLSKKIINILIDTKKELPDYWKIK